MDRGTLAHLVLLQPELLMDRVAVWRGGRRVGNDWDQFTDANPGKLIIPSDSFKEISSAVNIMRTQSAVSNLLCGIKPEVAILDCEKIDGTLVATKGQVDGVNVAKKVIIDIKTTEAGIGERAVERTVRYMHYREKMALYRRWMARATKSSPDDWRCYDIFMSLVPPYGIRIVQLSSLCLEWGEERMLNCLREVVGCINANDFPMFRGYTLMDVASYEIEEENDEEVEYERRS